VAPLRDWNAAEIDALVATPVVITDVDGVLANRTVSVDDEDWRLEFDATDIEALLSGAAAVVRAQALGDREAPNRLLRLVPPILVDQPRRPTVQVHDLARFLADPHLPAGPHSQPGPSLALTGEQVRTLRTDGRTRVELLDASIDLLLGDGGGDGIMAWADGPVAPAAADLTSTPNPSPAAWELAVALTWHQRWRLRGYTRGELLSTITLAPQEETTIELFTWDRHRDEQERSSSVDSDNSLDTSDTTRDTTDVLTETKNDSSFNWNVHGGLTLPATSALPINLGGMAGGQQQMAALTRTTTGHVHEAVTRGATKVRMARQSKIIASREWGREQRTTRTLRNANMCRTLDLDYFEVLASYEVTTAFDHSATRLCVLVPSPLTPSFVRDTVRRHETPLRRALLDRALEPGFAAVRLLAARSVACQVACERCSCNGTGGEPPDTLPDYVLAVIREAAGAWLVLKQASLNPTLTGTPDEQYRTQAAQARRWAYCKAIVAAAPELVLELNNVLAAVFGGSPITRSDVDAVWWALKNAGGVEAIRPPKLLTERKADINDAAGQIYSQTTQPGTMYTISPAQFAGATANVIDDFGLATHLDRFAVSYSGLPAAQAAQTASNPPAASGPTPSEQATDAVRDAFPLNQVADAFEREEALLAHLSENASYYWMALWNALSASQQAASLTRSLPDGLVDPWPIGMVGTRLAFPIVAAPGAQAFLDELLDLADKAKPITGTVTIPTAGITSEARLGACDGCEEYIRGSRTLDLRIRAADASIREAEADRRRARLDATTPDLDDPVSPPSLPVLTVRLEQPGSSPSP
jgi:hypothetical protein